MNPASSPTEIAIRTGTIGHLFNSIDPSPFREKDLDAGVEEFMVSWVCELPQGAPFTIVVHLPPEEAAKPEAARIGALSVQLPTALLLTAAIVK